MLKRDAGVSLLQDPVTNKGTAFTPEECASLGLEGLLPAATEDIATQIERVMEHLSAKPSERGSISTSRTCAIVTAPCFTRC